MFEDRTWTQWKATAGVAPAPADPDLAVLGPAVARACQLTAPGYLGAIKGLPLAGLSLIGKASAAANMLYSLLWGECGAQRGLGNREEAFRRLEANPSILADLREVAAPAISLTRCPWSCTATTPTTRSRRLLGGILLTILRSAALAWGRS